VFGRRLLSNQTGAESDWSEGTDEANEAIMASTAKQMRLLSQQKLREFNSRNRVKSGIIRLSDEDVDLTQVDWEWEADNAAEEVVLTSRDLAASHVMPQPPRFLEETDFFVAMAEGIDSEPTFLHETALADWDAIKGY